MAERSKKKWRIFAKKIPIGRDHNIITKWCSVRLGPTKEDFSPVLGTDIALREATSYLLGKNNLEYAMQFVKNEQKEGCDVLQKSNSTVARRKGTNSSVWRTKGHSPDLQ